MQQFKKDEFNEPEFSVADVVDGLLRASAFIFILYLLYKLTWYMV